MFVKRQRSWELPDSEATPEHVFLNRRSFVAGGAALAAGGLVGRAPAWADTLPGLYPAKRNPAYTLDRPLTPESANTDYNNYSGCW